MVIVAAVDRSESAARVVAEADALAAAFDDEIHVVHVVSRSKFMNQRRTSAETGDEPSLDHIREVATDAAREAAASLDAPSEAVGLVGEPADRIVEYADEAGARYVVVSPRARSPTGKAVFGSVAQSVLLKSDVPVVTIVDRGRS